MKKALVTGAGGFIGHHLSRYLKQKGYWVRGVDIKAPEFSRTPVDEFQILDLRHAQHCLEATRGMDEVYALAANMGGIGFITEVRAEVMRDNVLINVNTVEACYRNQVSKVFYASSACVYPVGRQTDAVVTALKESDAYPAEPDNEYGWEKIFSERLYLNYAQDYGLNVRIGRFHNIYGPEGTYAGGREKAPAALCRKVVEAGEGSPLRIWGDGNQTRSFCYVDDCLEAVYRLMQSDFRSPLNIGSDRLVTINELADVVMQVAGKSLKKIPEPGRPQGVRGRNSDNTLLRQILQWEPEVTLEDGIARTYCWIYGQLQKKPVLTSVS